MVRSLKHTLDISGMTESGRPIIKILTFSIIIRIYSDVSDDFLSRWPGVAAL